MDSHEGPNFLTYLVSFLLNGIQLQYIASFRDHPKIDITISLYHQYKNTGQNMPLTLEPPASLTNSQETGSVDYRIPADDSAQKAAFSNAQGSSRRNPYF